jgi:hypothetical protein
MRKATETEKLALILWSKYFKFWEEYFKFIKGKKEKRKET